MESLAKKLEDWYNVKVTVGQVSQDHQFNGRFKRKSLEYVMDALSYASGIEYHLQGKELFIQTSKNDEKP